MICLNGFACISPLGENKDEAIATLQSQKSKYMDYIGGFLPQGQKAYLGSLPFELPSDCDCRNSSMLQKCTNELDSVLQLALNKYDKKRIGVVIGTSTSAITDVEQSVIKNYQENLKLFYDNRLCEIGNLSDFIKNRYKLEGPCYTVATACSSGGKALVSGAELLKSGVCDVVIVGASDSLSKITVSGFFALGALSIDPCQPFALNRCGINISEAAGITIMSKEPLTDDYIKLLGYGMTSDGYHISAPEPTGTEGINAVNAAMKMAGVFPKDIGYVNMHGTGTKLNDSMEGNIIRGVFGNSVPFSSTKHITGHTLGAAAIVEAYISWLILNNNLDLPYHPYNYNEIDDEFKALNILHTFGNKLKTPIIMSNNFAFGGNNISLIFGK